MKLYRILEPGEQIIVEDELECKTVRGGTFYRKVPPTLIGINVVCAKIRRCVEPKLVDKHWEIIQDRDISSRTKTYSLDAAKRDIVQCKKDCPKSKFELFEVITNKFLEL